MPVENNFAVYVEKRHTFRDNRYLLRHCVVDDRGAILWIGESAEDGYEDAGDTAEAEAKRRNDALHARVKAGSKPNAILIR